jgi:hypothetical protein
MTEFARQFSQSGFPQLLDAFGEPVIYITASGARRSIRAIVERNPNATYDASGNVVLPELVIRVANNCKSGIGSSEFDSGGDRIEVRRRVGDMLPVVLHCRKMESQDSGVTVLAVM